MRRHPISSPRRPGVRRTGWAFRGRALGAQLVGDDAGASWRHGRRRPGWTGGCGSSRPTVDGRPGRRLLLVAAKDAGVGMAEAVDGLVDVTDGEEAVGAAQEVDQAPLEGVGVLQLVHQDLVEGLADGLADWGVIGEEADGELLKVAEVEQGAGALAVAVEAIDAAEGLHQQLALAGVVAADPLGLDTGAELILDGLGVDAAEGALLQVAGVDVQFGQQAEVVQAGGGIEQGADAAAPVEQQGVGALLVVGAGDGAFGEHLVDQAAELGGVGGGGQGEGRAGGQVDTGDAEGFVDLFEAAASGREASPAVGT